MDQQQSRSVIEVLRKSLRILVANDRNRSVAWKYDEDKDLDNFRTFNPANNWHQLALLLNRRHHGDVPVRTAQEVQERYAQITGEEDIDDPLQASNTSPQTGCSNVEPMPGKPVHRPQLTQAQSKLRAHYIAWESDPQTVPGITTYSEYAQAVLIGPPISSWYRVVSGPPANSGSSDTEVEEEECEREDGGHGISEVDGDNEDEVKQEACENSAEARD